MSTTKQHRKGRRINKPSQSSRSECAYALFGGVGGVDGLGEQGLVPALGVSSLVTELLRAKHAWRTAGAAAPPAPRSQSRARREPRDAPRRSGSLGALVGATADCPARVTHLKKDVAEVSSSHEKSPWQFRRKRSVVFVTELQITRLSVATSCFRCCCGVFSPHTLIQRKSINDVRKQPIQHTKPVFVVPVPSTRVRSQAACTTTETTTTISTSTTKEEQG